MKMKSFQESLFAKIISVVIIANFIITAGPVSAYANTLTSDQLRTAATKDTEVVGELAESLEANSQQTNPIPIKRIGVLTGGGPASGHNAVLYSIVKRAQELGIEVWAIWDGWNGLVDDGLVAKARLLTLEELEQSRRKGGTYLGTDRVNPYSKTNMAKGIPQKLWENKQKLGLDAVASLGGGDTIGVTFKLLRDYDDFQAAGGAKTMDNDIDLPDPRAETYGFDSFTEAGTRNAEYGITDAKSTHRVMVAGVFGRGAGYVASRVGSRVGATRTLIPEIMLDLEQLVEDVRAYYKENRYAFVLVSEGIRLDANYRNNAALLEAAFKNDTVAKAAYEKAMSPDAKKDDFGHPKLEKAETIINAVLEAALKQDNIKMSPAEKISYLFRSADASEKDFQYCDLLGAGIVDGVAEGKNNQLFYVVDGRVESMELVEELEGRELDFQGFHREEYLAANQALPYDRVEERVSAKEDNNDVDHPYAELINSLDNPAARKESLEQLAAVDPEIKDFLDLFLIKNEGRVDLEQLAALRSRLSRRNSPNSSIKRLAIFGDDQISRLAVRGAVDSGYDNVELVSITVEKPKDKDKDKPALATDKILPLITRDSRHGHFLGRAKRGGAKDEFLYLGDQSEAVRVFTEKDFLNIAEDFPWDALAVDVVYIDEAMYKKIGKKVKEALGAKNIQLVVSKKNGEGFITYVPGLVDEAIIQKESAINVAASDEVAVALGVDVLSTLGELQYVSTTLMKSLGGQIPATYRLPGAHQAEHTTQDLYSGILAEKLGLDPAKIVPTGVLAASVRRGQVVALIAGIAADVSKEDVIKAFTDAAETNDLLALPEEGVELTSNLIWGEKRIFFDSNPGSIYVLDDGKSGGKRVMVLLFIDEDVAHVDHVMGALARRSSAKEPVAKLEEEQLPPYAASEIMGNLSEAANQASDAKEEQKAQQEADKHAQLEALKKNIRENMEMRHPGEPQILQSSAPLFDIPSHVKPLFPGVEELPFHVPILFGTDGQKVGLAFYQNDDKAINDNTIIAASLVSADSPENMQDALITYYTALRKRAFEISRKNGNKPIEVIDNYRPQQNLRVRFIVSADNPTETTYKSVEQLIGGEWIVLSEPNMQIDSTEFEGKYVVVENAPGGRIGSLWIKLASEKPDLRIIALGGPTSEDLAAFLDHGDYIQGRYPGEVKAIHDQLILDGKNAVVFGNRVNGTFRDPINYPWGTFAFAGVRVNLAYDASGQFLDKKGLEYHLQAGADRSLASAPGKDDFPSETNTFVVGINDHKYDPKQHFIVSTASCTTGCLAMLNRTIETAMVLKNGVPATEAYDKELIAALDEVVTGLVATLHVPTSEKIAADTDAKSRKRDIDDNIVPTTTGAARNIGFADVATVNMDGLAIRFPGDVGSLTDVHYTLKGKYKKEDIIAAAELVAERTGTIMVQNVKYSGQIRLIEEIRRMMATIGPDNISVVNYENTEGQPMSLVRLSGWYENEYYYAGEAVDFVDETMRQKENKPALKIDQDGNLVLAVSGSKKQAGSRRSGVSVTGTAGFNSEFTDHDGRGHHTERSEFDFLDMSPESFRSARTMHAYRVDAGGGSLSRDEQSSVEQQVIDGAAGINAAATTKAIDVAQALGVSQQELVSYFAADYAVYNAIGGEELAEFLHNLADVDVKDKRGLIVSSSFLKVPGAANAILETVKFNKSVEVAVYGEGVQNLNVLLGNNGIIVTETFTEAANALLQYNVASENMLLLRTPDEKLEKVMNIRQVVANNMATIAVAKSIKELLGSEKASWGLELFYSRLAVDKAISNVAYNKNYEKLQIWEALEATGVFELSQDLKPTEEVAKRIEADFKTCEEFMKNI